VAKNVPIAVVERPIIVGTEVGEIGGNTYTKAIPDKSGYSETPVAGGRAIEVPGENVYTEATPKVDIVPPQPEILKVPNTISPTGNPFELREYQNYLTQKWGSMDQFYRQVNEEINLLDNKEYSILENNSFFGENYNSAYDKFLGMSIDEIDKFVSQSNDLKRTELAEGNIKYESYLVWEDIYKDMKNSKLQIGLKTNFASLFEQYFDKTSAPVVNPLTSSYVN
jgi:hypothetical protein